MHDIFTLQNLVDGGISPLKFRKMENSHEHSDLMHHEDENQVFLFTRQLGLVFINHCVGISLKTLQYISFPVVLMYSFWTYALEQMWQISKQILKEIFDLMKIVPLTLELWFYSALIFVQVVFFLEKIEKATVKVEKKLYGILKIILGKSNVLPLSKQNAIALYSFMMRIPIFGKGRLPFPQFLFEDNFSEIKFGKGVIWIVPSSNDSIQPGAETTALAQPETLVVLPEVSSEDKPEAAPVSRKSSIKTNEKPNIANSSSVPVSSDSESDAKTSSSF